MQARAEIYAGTEIALLTRHGKQRVIAPALEDALGCRVHHVDGYDTDPFSGMSPWNVEVIVFIGSLRNLEIVGIAQDRGNFRHLLTHEWRALETFAQEAGFPHQQLVVRPRDEHDRCIRKGIHTWAELEAALAWAVAAAENGLAFVETDDRAHANPTRMANVGLAAADLAVRLASPCPACGTPGYWQVDRVAGLPCAGCGAPTRETRAWVHGCLKCAHRETHPLSGPSHVDPGCCDVCNP